MMSEMLKEIISEKSKSLFQKKETSGSFRMEYSVFQHLQWKARNECLGKVPSFLLLPLPNASAGGNMDQVRILSLLEVTWMRVAQI